MEGQLLDRLIPEGGLPPGRILEITFFYDWDWRGAERAFLRSIELRPNNGEALADYALFLAFEGRVDEAMTAGRKALALDPLGMPRARVAEPGARCPDCGTDLVSEPGIAGLCPQCLLSQAYFAQLLEKGYPEDFDPAMGRFRVFLMASMRNFLSKERELGVIAPWQRAS